MHEITQDIAVKKAIEQNERYIQVHNRLWDDIIKPYIYRQEQERNENKM